MSECKYYQELISRMLDRDLSKRERAAVMEHLDSCSECAAMYEAFSMLSNNVSANLADPPEELTEDIMANIRRSEMIRKNRKTSRQLKTVIAAAACVAVLVAVVGGFTVIKNLRRQNVVYEQPKLSESNISVDPASGSTSADGLTEAAVAGTNTNTGSQSNLPPIQFGETHVSSSASAQQVETTLPEFPSTPEQNNTWYGNNSQQSDWYGNNSQQSYGSTQQYVQPQQQPVQVQQQPVQVQQQPVQVQQQPGSNVVVLPAAPNTAQSSVTAVPTPTPAPKNSPAAGFSFFRFLRPHKNEAESQKTESAPQQTYTAPQQTYVEPTPTPYVEPTPTPTPYVEPTPTPTPYVEPEPVYTEPTYPEQETVYTEPTYPEQETVYTEPTYTEPETVYTEPTYTEPETVYTEPTYTEPETVYTEPTYTEQEPAVVGDPLMEQPPVEEETAPVEESVADSKEPVRVDLTDRDTDAFIAALLGISEEESAAPTEESFFTDGTEYGQDEFADGAEFGSGEFPDGAGFEEAFPAAVEASSDPWDEILPDDTDADRTDILLYRFSGEDRELEVRLYGDEVYLIYDDENDSKTCTQAEYSADIYKTALEEFVSGSSDTAVQLLTEPKYY